ncbi:cell wall-binding protein [Dehalococcoides mccartyi]|uniref:Cell wall-binding protein n=1 Tax=Dehalococcoides mccartyi TaxID=61435 RepID=A0A0V8LXM0_9CHLR|nr:InlB B-repeat-containing protein [Dehalococcoides mccartyi]KSV16250.1 cell wall-binding protein [Dehalococcoides mccartyi]
MPEKELNPEPDNSREPHDEDFEPLDKNNEFSKENSEPADEYEEPPLEPETPAEVSQSEKIPGYYFYRRKQAKTKLKGRHSKMPAWFNISLAVLIVLGVIFGSWGLTAGHFPPWGIAVDVSISPSGGGTVNLSPDKSSYSRGSSINLNAVAATGYRFDHWSGDLSGTNPAVSLSLNSSKNIVANFVRQFQLNISTSPQAGGSLSTVSGSFDAGSVIELSANPMQGYRFDHWSGDLSGTNPAVSLSLNSSKNIVANFVRQFQLNISTSPQAGGSLSTVSGSFDAGSVIELSANPMQGYRFDHWSGDLSGTDPSISFIMDANKTIVANFVPLLLLAVNISPNAAGIVTPEGDYFDYGASITLTAQAAPGYQFIGWTGDLTTNLTTINITMDKNYTLTANFAPVIQTSSLVLPNRIGESTWISWSKELLKDQYIVINSSLTGAFNLSDSSHLWRVEVFGPDGEHIENWFGDYWLTPEHIFAFTAQVSGTYMLKISHYSSFIKDLNMSFSPGGWVISGYSWS